MNLDAVVERDLAKAKARLQKFESLVRKQEAYAKANPSGYRSRVIWMAALGYGYILLVLLVAFALFGGVLWLMFTGHLGSGLIKITVFLAIFLFLVLRSMWVRFGAPEGVTLSRKEVPELYAEVDQLAKSLGAPPVESILITDEMNAAAVQRPRLGIFGWYRNDLVLGLPLLLASTPDEARSVIAHEFGHFSGEHGKLGGWIYRVNATFERINASLDKEGQQNLIFGPFFHWFSPRFSACSFAMRRINEYEADRAAANSVGVGPTSKMLMRVCYLGEAMNKAFWIPLGDQAKQSSEIPANLFSEFARAAKGVPAPEELEAALRTALDERTGYTDTHPSLTDRLGSLGVVPGEDLSSFVAELSVPIEKDAAHVFLGAAYGDIERRLEKLTVEQITEGWAKTNGRYSVLASQLAELDKKAEEVPLSVDDRLKRGILIEQMSGLDAAFPIYEQLMVEAPDHGGVNYWYGAALEERDDARCLEFLQRARELDPDLVLQSTRSEANYHARHGNHDEVDKLGEVAMGAHIRKLRAEALTVQISIKDKFVAAGLPESVVSGYVRQLKLCPLLEKAYLVTRPSPVDPNKPQIVLVVFRKKKFIESGNEREVLSQEVMSQVEIGSDWLLYAPVEDKPWMRRMKKIPGALIYDAKAKAK